MMEATQKLEATQVLDFSSALDDEEAQEGVIVGRLVVEGVTHLVSGSEWNNSSIIIMNEKRICECTFRYKQFNKLNNELIRPWARGHMLSPPGDFCRLCFLVSL